MSEDCQHDFITITQVTDNFTVSICNICGKPVVGFDLGTIKEVNSY